MLTFNDQPQNTNAVILNCTQALLRDGRWCVLSKAIDNETYLREPEAFPIDDEGNEFVAVTTVRHIISIHTQVCSRSKQIKQS